MAIEFTRSCKQGGSFPMAKVTATWPDRTILSRAKVRRACNCTPVRRVHFSVVMLKHREPLRYVFPYGLLPTATCFPHSVKEVQSWQLTTASRWAERLNQRINLDLDVTARHSHGRFPIRRVLRHGRSPFKRAVSQKNAYWDPWARDGSRETRFFLTYAKFDSFSMHFCCRPMSVRYDDCRRLKSFGTWLHVGWVSIDWHFARACHPLSPVAKQPKKSGCLDPQNGDSEPFLNVVCYVPVDTVSHPRRLVSSSVLLWGSEV